MKKHNTEITRYRVSWEVLGKKMASEYTTRSMAEMHQKDIAGYGLTTELEEITSSDPIQPGPFEIPPRKNLWERLDDD